MKKSIKKGFTLVELLVVIAIIAILSIVGIVGYVSFTNRARVSNDTTIVTELNRVLQAEHVNKKPSTMQDVVDEIFDAGFDLTKLTPTAAKHHIVYDSRPEVDRFYLLNEEGKVVGGDLDGKVLTSLAPKEKLWKVVQTYSEAEEGNFSYYLGKMKNENTSAELTVSTGIDVGSNTVAQINYTGGFVGKEVVIRTNSAATTLTIDAESDVIHHYDALGALNIIKAKTSSYHENGKVAYAEIAYGRIVLESGSKVEEIHVNKKTDSSFDTVIIANNGGAEELPERITRDAVTVSAETLVVKVEANGASENVYVYADGGTGTKGSTQKITEGENRQNENVNSALGQLVLDNGASSDKAQTAEEKQAAKEEAVEEAVVEEIETDDRYVARIGRTPYESLKDAVAGANPNDVIEMTANDIDTENISINKRITINMNEKTFGGMIVIATNGNDYVKINGSANVDAVSKLGNYYFAKLYIQRTGVVTLLKDTTMSQVYFATSGNSGDYIIELNGHTLTLSENSSEGGIYIQSWYGTNDKLTIRNGDIVFTGTSSSANAFHVYGDLVLENVNVLSSCGTAIKTEAAYWDGPGHVTVTGGSITSQGKGLDLEAYKSGNTIKQSTAVLTGVIVAAKNEAVKSNGASCTIENCSISSTNSCGVSTFSSTSGSNPSQVTISGNSSITATSTHAINCTSGTLQISGNVEVTGSVYTQSSSITIVGGVYQGNFSLGGSGQLVIAGGAYNGNLIDVTQAGRLLVIGETQFDELVTYSITGSNGSYDVSLAN